MIKTDLLTETTADAVKKSIKESADYTYALEESFMVAITDQKGIALMNKYLQKTYPCAKSVI